MLIFPLINDTSRKIIHIDMDAFFASVEERDNPKLKGHPVIIGSDPRLTGGRGVVSTCNYEARKFGVHSAMRENKLGIKSAVKIAKLIQHDIWNELQLTASAGVSYNKFLAKIASDYEKPHGLTVILPEEAEAFLAPMDIAKFHGVGKKSVEKLHELGIYTGADLLKIPEMTLIDKFGRFGFDLYRKARGISNSPVKSNRIRKSIGKERTYAKLLYGEEDIKKELTLLAQKVENSLTKHDKKGRTIVLKIRYADFSTLTKRKSLNLATQDKEQIERTAHEIYDSLEEQPRGIRLLGLTVTGFE